MKELLLKNLQKIDEYTFEIDRSFRPDMHVNARLFAHDNMLKDICSDKSLLQLINVASLPGIVQAAYAMPDVHEGYGFPIGGVAAFDIEQGGVISPGGIGYDINCGVRLLTSSTQYTEIKQYIDKIATKMFERVPSGVGRGGRTKLSDADLNKILEGGAQEMLDRTYGDKQDIAFCEEQGKMEGADHNLVSHRAKKRGFDQLGTLGSGNHFLEMQYVQEVYDEHSASVYGLKKGDVTVMIHCGSRGLGHQVCSDYVRAMLEHSKDFKFSLPDRELMCAPFNTSIGQEYFSAMKAAANFAWANRHMIAHWVRRAWRDVLGDSVQLSLVYDLSHNIGKIEEHMVNDTLRKLIVHRKGATRSFGPGRKEIPVRYQEVGQPVLIPGTMGTASYVFAGTHRSMELAWGSSCHGAGRAMSRSKAKQQVVGSQVRADLEALGIVVKSSSDHGLAEEAPFAYKDVNLVADVLQGAGLARKVAKLVPCAVIKGD